MSLPNRLTDRPSTCRVSASGATANYTYDPNGNLLSKVDGADTWTYTWNAENELTKVQKSGAEVARFAYDPLGRRVEKVAGGVTTTYAYDGAGILREIRDGSALKYVHGLAIDEMLAVDDGTLGYFHQDALGSVLKMTNVAGVVTLTRQYDAWGNLEAGAGSPGFAFTGREWDSETGLHYYRARYYDARDGRFISQDPAGLRGGLNRYTYVGGNPATYSDPSGLLRYTTHWNFKFIEGMWGSEMSMSTDGPHPGCTEKCGEWRLEFVLRVHVNVTLATWCPSAFKHEMSHVNYNLNFIERALQPLYAAEAQPYGSFTECIRAGYAAAAAFKSTRGSRIPHKLIDTAQIPCLFQM